MAGRARIGARRRVWRDGLLIGVEPIRALSEFAASALLAPLLALQPRGDGHCVLVIPGWLVGDTSTLSLRRYLSVLGYDVRGWGQGINHGPTTNNVAALQRYLTELAASVGRSVSVIGWSLGGHYAYQLARRNPAAVRQVITLGSPAAMGFTVSKAGSRLADRLPPGSTRLVSVPRPWDEAASLRVPITAIYSRSDAIVAWRTSRIRPARRRQNVQVHASHLGLPHNPAVLHAIADRLSTSPDQWTPFRPTPLLKPFFVDQGV